MNKNKSSAYGYYGGVTPANHYVPPPVPDFVPQPPQGGSILTQTDRSLLEQLVQQTAFYAENAPHILLRTNTLHLSNNVDSFMMTTSADPEDVIVYTSETDNFNLNIVNGGQF
jgi:hypothetical protein